MVSVRFGARGSTVAAALTATHDVMRVEIWNSVPSCSSRASMLAVFPPLYLAGSGIDTPILGVPFSVAYWIFDALLATGAVWLLWIFENIRGEVGEEPEEVAA